MSVLFRVEKCRVSARTIPWSFGTAASSCTAVTMVRKGLETCTNAASRTASTSGKKSRARVFSRSIASATQLSSFRTRCLSLEDGTGTIQWTTFFSIVSSQITGMRSTGQLELHHSLVIDTQLWYVRAKSTFLVELTQISKGSTTSTNLISISESGRR